MIAAGHNITETPSRGPRPLPVFLSMAMAEGLPHDQILAMLEGVRLYQDHPFRRPPAVYEKVAQDGTVTLYRVPESRGPAVLLIPSLINRFHILDLLPDRSFARALAGEGFGIYILDWGDAPHDPGLQSLESLMQERLLPALEILHAREGTYAAIGYCMGGTLLAGAAAQRPPGLTQAVFLAAPWDFHGGDCALQGRVLSGTPAALEAMQSAGVLASGWIQSVFASLSVGRNAEKFARFAALNPESEEARLFVATEDWLNDGVDLPQALARSCLMDWYGRNTPARGGWVGPDGALLDPAHIAARALVAVSEADRLVPVASAQALAAQITGAELLTVRQGHIGMMTSRSAPQDLWRKLADWLHKA